ncbi:MAG: tol-pal system-associated acyl-CoA thioesterase [Pseudomonadota bacterium]|jgi:acyl-CoA thioester hydrolase
MDADRVAQAGERVNFRWPVRVYWEDTDAGGIVFYANYLKYFERARTEWLRARGIGQQALREAEGVIFVVLDTQLSYLRPARLDDMLEVSVEPARAGGASLVFTQRAWRGEELLAQGTIRVACVEASTLQPRRLPPTVVQCLP